MSQEPDRIRGEEYQRGAIAPRKLHVKRRPPYQPDPQAWLLTFSDLLFLLLTAFVFRLSMSSLTIQTLRTTLSHFPSSAMQEGVTPTSRSHPANAADPRPWHGAPEPVSRLADQLTDALGELRGIAEIGDPEGRTRTYPGNITVRFDDKTLTVALPSGTFAEDTSELTFHGAEVVSLVVRSIQGAPFSVSIRSMVRGGQAGEMHAEASAQPWVLARTRAMELIRQFLDAGVGSHSLSAGARACFPPLDRCPGAGVDGEIRINLAPVQSSKVKS